MIKHWFKKMWDSLADTLPPTRADRRHWYLVNKIAVLEEKVRAMEEAAERASKRD